MIVLGIESAGKRGGVALNDGPDGLAEAIFEKGMVHGREIAPAVQRLCKEAGLNPRDIGLIGVDIGPGSYTGLRVGIAAAKALAFALGRPVVGIPSLDALAEAALPHAPEETTLCAMIDARWEQVYGALYSPTSPPERKTELLATTPAEFIADVPAGAFVFGDAISRHHDLIEKAGLRPAEPDLWHPHPSVIARMALRRHETGNSGNHETLGPLYLKKTEAEENLSRKKLRRLGNTT